MLGPLDDQGHEEIRRMHLWCTTAITQVDLMVRLERSVVTQSEEGGLIRVVRPEQNRLSCVTDDVANFSSGRQLVEDSCVERFSVAKGCMMLPKHR